MFAYGFESGGGRCGPGRRGVRGRHGFSGAPFEFGGGHAFGGWGRGPRGRGRKARRGDARTAALLLLAEEPRNGYQIMQEIEERSEGLWRPGPAKTSTGSSPTATATARETARETPLRVRTAERRGIG